MSYSYNFCGENNKYFINSFDIYKIVLSPQNHYAKH